MARRLPISPKRTNVSSDEAGRAAPGQTRPGPYSKIARSYAGSFDSEDDPVMRARCRDLFCERLRGPRVLEIGCGPGKDAFALQQRGLSITATDACREFVDIVRERYPTIEVHRMDFREPNLPEGSFYDGIWGFAAFIHVKRTVADQVLVGLRDLLVPGGILFLSLIRSTMVAEYVVPDWGGIPNNPAFFSCYGKDELKERLERAGLGEIEFFDVSSPFYESMPRLVERGVHLYQVACRRLPGPILRSAGGD